MFISLNISEALVSRDIHFVSKYRCPANKVLLKRMKLGHLLVCEATSIFRIELGYKHF